METIKSLNTKQLCWRCDPSQFEFETTDDLEKLSEIIGQPRAVEAMQFGINIEQDGYNIFALGAAGTGKRTLLRGLFEDKAADKPVPYRKQQEVTTRKLKPVEMREKGKNQND